MKKIPKPYLYLIIVSLIAIVVWYLEKPTTSKKGDILNQALLKDFSNKDIARFEIEHLLNGVQLKKTGDNWKVAALETKLKSQLNKKERKEGEKVIKWYEADNSKIDFNLDILRDTELKSLVGNNPEKHGPFEVTEATGMQFRLFDAEGKVLGHFYFGKSSGGFMESYLRKEGEKEVYLTNRILRGAFPTKVVAWRNKTLWDIPPQEIEVIQVERKKKPFTLKKREGQWNLTDPKEEIADTTKVGNILSQLAKIRVDGFEGEETKKMGLKKPLLLLTVISTTGPYTLRMGKKNDAGQFYAQKEGEPQIYLIGGKIGKAIPEDWNALIAKQKAETESPKAP